MASENPLDQKPGKQKTRSPGIIGTITRKLSDMSRAGALKSVKSVRDTHIVTFEGFLRKRSSAGVLRSIKETVNMKWSLFYVVLTETGAYYFKNESAEVFEGKFSLYGYNVVKRVSDDMKNSTWPEFSFMIRHASQDSQYKTYYFSTTKQDDMKVWMMKFRESMHKANRSLVNSMTVQYSPSSVSIDDLEEPVYQPNSELSYNTSITDDVESDPDESYSEIKELEDLCKVKDGVYFPVGCNPIRDDALPVKIAPRQQSPPDLYKPPRDPLPPLPSRGPLVLPLQSEKKPHTAKKPLSMPSSSASPQSHPSNPWPPLNTGFIKELGEKLNPVRKPTVPVKPLLVRDDIYWNGDKEQASQALRTETKGVFLVRQGTSGSNLVLVISRGDGTIHSLKIVAYRNNKIGLKKEDIVTEEEQFHNIHDLVKYYRTNSIYLQSGSLEIKLTKPLSDCDSAFY